MTGYEIEQHIKAIYRQLRCKQNCLSPSGDCNENLYLNQCLDWVAVSGSGTVTSFAFTDNSSFNGTVTNATTTPTLSLEFANPVSLANGGTGAALADPGGDRLVFWDDSGTTMEWLTLGTNLSITGTTLNASGSSGWGLTGNAGTTAGTNFIGTTDATDFVTKAANTERFRIVNTDGSVQMGGLGNLTAGFGVPRLSVATDVNGSSTLNISNANAGTSARACLVVSGEADLLPAVNARYFTMMVGSSGYTDVPYWANSAVLFSGGGLIGGIKVYCDDGPIQLGTRYTDPSDYPADIWIAPLSLNGVIQTSPVPGYIAIGHKSPVQKLDVLGGTFIHSSGSGTGTIVSGDNLFKTACTFAAGSTTSTYANLIDVTGAGSANQLTNAFRVVYNAGYTGAGRPVGALVYNASAGTGNDLGWATSDSTPFGNGGVIAFSSGTTTGFNYGVWGEGNLAILNIGVVGKAATAKNSGTNIGILGQARNTGSSPIEVGGYFTLGAAAPTFASAALMADNADRARDIFVARDNGTAVFTVADGGASTFTSSVSTTNLIAGNKSINTTAGDSATINAMAGRFRKDTSGTTFTLTNSFVTANSIVILDQANAAFDGTATSWTKVCSANTVTIEFNAAPTSNFDMDFLVIN